MGSEMCIRDRRGRHPGRGASRAIGYIAERRRRSDAASLTRSQNTLLQPLTPPASGSIISGSLWNGGVRKTTRPTPCKRGRTRLGYKAGEQTLHWRMTLLLGAWKERGQALLPSPALVPSMPLKQCHPPMERLFASLVT